MRESFTAETLKLRKRPATWIIGLIFAAAVILFGYLFTYVFAYNAPGGAGLPQEAREGILQSLLPGGMLRTVLGNFASFGSALALVLGALAVGSEYGWETFKVSSSQGPGRLGLFTGKLLAVGVILAVLTIVILALGAVASYLIASVENAGIEWPSAGELLKGLGAGWLILAAFAAMGIFLATLFRGSALAIALGLVYLLVLENLFLGLATLNDTVQNIGKYLPAKNSLDLSESFGNTPQAIFGGAPGEAVSASHAVITLAVYLVVFLAISLLLFRRRDIA